MSDLEKAMQYMCEKLTREELIQLICILTKEGVNKSGHKKKEA